MNEPGSSISRAFAWTFVGRMLYGTCQWGILSVLAKLGDTILVGRFALALAVTAPLGALANLQLRSIYATDVHDEFSWSTYWRLRVRLSALYLVLMVAGTWASVELRDDVWTIGVIAAAKAVEMVEDLLYGVFQRHGALHYFGRSLAIRGVMSLLAVTVALAAGLPLEACAGVMLVVWVAVLVWHDLPRATRIRTSSAGKPRVSHGDWRLLWLALPMGLVMLIDSLNQNVPRYFIESFEGTAQLGIYVAMAYVIQFGGLIVFSLGAPLASVMARDYSERRRRRSFVRSAVGLIVLTAGLGALGVLFAWLVGPSFLRLVYSEPFAAAADVFVWVMAGAAFHYIILACNNVLTAARWLRAQPIIWGVALASTTAAAWAFVPMHGITGAAQAFVVGVAVGAAVAVGSVVAVIHGMRGRKGR